MQYISFLVAIIMFMWFLFQTLTNVLIPLLITAVIMQTAPTLLEVLSVLAHLDILEMVSYVMVCYQTLFYRVVSSFTDIDECSSEQDFPCDSNANCSNTIGSYICTCLIGFTGDGHSCEGEADFQLA